MSNTSLAVGHDVDYYLRNAGTGGVGYYNRGDEPPGLWAGKAAERLGLTGNVEPDVMRALFHKLVSPDGERLYRGKPPAYVRGDTGEADEAAGEALAELGPFATPAEKRAASAKARAKVSQSVPYFDMTISASRSVSLTWASLLADGARAEAEGRDEDAAKLRARARLITDALRDTALQQVARLEERAGFVRTGHHSSHTGEWRDANGLVAAVFMQHDNREGEPHLHAHTVVLNRAQRADQGDQRWRTLYGRALFQERLGQAGVNDRILAQKLSAQGFRMVQQPAGESSEIGGIDREYIEAFAQRTKAQVEPHLLRAIEEYKATHGGEEPSPRMRWFMKQAAGKQTRRAKPKEPKTGTDRLAAWEQRARDAGVQALHEVHEAVAEFGQHTGPPAVLTAAQRERTVRIAAREVQAHHAAWSASHLMWELHRALPVLPADVDPVPALESLLADTLAGQMPGVEPVMLDPAPAQVDISYLGTRDGDGQSVHEAPGRARYALSDALDAEEHLIRQAGKPRPQLVDPDAAAGATAAAKGLGAEQATALEALLASDRAAMFIRAAAGTGKTRLVGELAKAWTETTGGRVIVTTLSENATRVAAKEMEEAGAQPIAFNIARLLGQRKDGSYRNPVPIYERDVIVVDEATQVGTGNLLRLQAMADEAGARLVLVGDEFQLSAVEAGGMFATLADRHGAHELHEVHRFQQAWERDASLRLRKGDATVIAEYQARGRVFHGRDGEVRQGLVLDWAADMRAGKDALMITATNEQAADLNRRAREHLLDVRFADGENVPAATVDLADGNRAGQGDWIRARLNDHLTDAAGKWLANRDTLRIRRITGAGDQRKVFAERRETDGSWTKPFMVPVAYVEQSAELGYASTVFSAQGRTVDTGHGLVTEGMNRETQYVLATRGREENRLHVVTGRDDLELQTTPEAVLGAALARPQADQSAHEVMRQAMDDVDHPARLLELYDATVRDEVAAKIDDGVRARIGPEAYDRYVSDPARATLHQALRATELAGADLGDVLDRVTTRDLGGAHSVANVLHGRLNASEQAPERQAVREDHRGVPWAERLPEAHRAGPARELAQEMDTREQAEGERLAERPEPWVLERLGVPPQEAGALRDDWVARAGMGGFYRQTAGISDPKVCLGVRPSNDAARGVAWDRAAGSLEVGRDTASAQGQAELESTVRGYARVNEQAPRDVADELQRALETQVRAERQAEEAQARGDEALAEGSRTVAAEEAGRAESLGVLQDGRDRWDRVYATDREAAREAQLELERRGVDAEDTGRPDPEPEPVVEPEPVEPERQAEPEPVEAEPEPVVEPDAEPVTAEAEPVAEPVVIEPVNSDAEWFANRAQWEAEDAAKAAAETTPEPQPEPVAEPAGTEAAEPVSEPAEPVTEPAPEQAEPVAEPVAEGGQDRAAEPVAEPVAEVAEPVAETVAEPVAETTPEPAPEPVAEPVKPERVSMAEEVTRMQESMARLDAKLTAEREARDAEATERAAESDAYAERQHVEAQAEPEAEAAYAWAPTGPVDPGTWAQADDAEAGL